MYTVTIEILVNSSKLVVNLTNKTLISDNVSLFDAVKYLKGIYTNRERFIARFITPILNIATSESLDEKSRKDFECSEFMTNILKIYESVDPFSYNDAFKIENDQFRALVFGSIDITDMINNLGSNHISKASKLVKHKKFDENGNFLGYKEYDAIYEVYEISGKNLNLDENFYAVKCWCTSTNKENWIWIEPEYKNDPLEAIASTFRIHKNLIPYIKELKRQGDILLVELSKDITPEGEIVPLTANQYFSMLTAQS